MYSAASTHTPGVFDRTQMKASNIDRALGPTENIYLLLDKLYGLNFVIFAEIDGVLDAQRLTEALHTVQIEHPLLRARVVLVGGRHWFKSIEADAHPIPVESGAMRNWRAQLSAQLDQPFPDTGPLARFQWFGGPARKSVAAMVFHHVIGDGRSGADVFIEVLRRAAGEKLPLHCRPARASAQDLDLIKQQGTVGTSIKTIAYWLKQGKTALKFAQQLPGFDMGTHDQRRIEVVPFALPKVTTKSLREACRAHRTTVHGALGAAQLLAINDEFPTARARHLARTRGPGAPKCWSRPSGRGPSQSPSDSAACWMLSPARPPVRGPGGGRTAGSPTGSWRCCAWCARGRRTATSPAGWSSARTPRPITCDRS